MKRRLSLSILFSLVFALLAYSASTHAKETKEIVIGASVALTGQYARNGQDQLDGFNMWVEEVNARGGMLGQKVRLVYYDDESTPATGQKLYEKLITHDQVDLLIGPYSSDVAMAASTVAEKYNFPMVLPGASASAIWMRGYKNIFGIYTPGSTYMDQVLEFAKSKGLKRVALVYQDTAFPRDVAKGVRAKIKALKMNLVFDEEYDHDSTNFTSTVIKIKSKKAEIIIGASYLPDSMAFVRQAKENRVYAKIFSFAAGPASPDFGDDLGLDAEGVMSNTQWESTLNLPGAKEFAQRYTKKYAREPGSEAAGGYGAGQVLEAAVKKAGAIDQDKLRKAFTELDILTAFGRHKTDSSGIQIGKPGYTLQWINGARQVILPPNAATRKPLYPFKDWAKR